MALLRLVGLSLSTLAGVVSGALSNPFRGKTGNDFYINPINFGQYGQSIDSASGQIKANLQEMQKVPSAYWIDVKEKIKATGTADDSRSLEGILRDAASKPKPQLCVFMWYDLPNRDCKAHASNGQICCSKNADGTCNRHSDGDCAEGLREYKEEYADPFIEVLQNFQHRVPIVVVVEPDSLPNLATNQAHPHCGSSATKRAYKEGIAYSLHQLAQKTPEVTVYLDAAHGGWMGWENSMVAFMKVLKSMNLPKIRGFATNVANYQPLGVQCPWQPDQGFRNSYCLNGRHQNDPCCADPCSLASQWNFGNNELNYAAGLVAAADQMLGWDAHVIIDTGRNGVVDHRSKCNSWCNPRGSGAGVRSTADVTNRSLVDAYFWLKTPGESDGCTQTLPEGGTCPRFDADCGAGDALGSRAGEPRSPEAGRWFDYQVKELAKNANFEAPPTVSQPPNSGDDDDSENGNHGNSGTTTTRASVTDPNSDHNGNDGTCSAAFGQCGGKNWNGPTCCESGCRCRHEGEWYSQCEPPAGNHMCGGGMIVMDEVQESTLVEAIGSATSSNVVMAGVTMMLVTGALVAIKLRKQRQQPAYEEDVEAVE